MIQYDMDGEMKRMSASYYRGDKPQFYPEDKTLARDSVVDRFLVKGWMPESAFISTAAPIVAFGSCFAANISNYLHERGYNVITKKEGKAAVSKVTDEMRQLRIEKRKQARSASAAKKREARRNLRLEMRKTERALARAGKNTGIDTSC